MVGVGLMYDVVIVVMVVVCFQCVVFGGFVIVVLVSILFVIGCVCNSIVGIGEIGCDLVIVGIIYVIIYCDLFCLLM